MVYTELRTVGGQQVRIVQWDGLRMWGQTGTMVFQIQLWESGEIALAYHRLDGSSESDRTSHRGGSLVVGIENQSGDEALLFLNRQRYLVPGMALSFFPK
jgi:hypothetical protein